MINYQIDILPIGDKKCGEAIAIRFGELELAANDPQKQTVVLIDGGYQGDAEMIVEHVGNHFNAKKIDLVVSTHDHDDHTGGLIGVVGTIPIDQLWMHQPWEHSVDMLASRREKFVSARLTDKLQKSLQALNDLQLAADAAGIVPVEPFSGRQFVSPYGILTVLGPSQAYYEELLQQILTDSEAKAQGQPVGLATELSNLIRKAAQAAAGVFESHRIETLTDNGETSPSNNTSAILLLELADKSERFLFCGDAGIPALERAYLEYTTLGYKTGDLNFVQVPHHGSRRNVGPTILDKFLGTRTVQPDMQRGAACVSVAKDCTDDGHPKKVVTNAFKRRGYPVTPTKGKGVMYGFSRVGWSSVNPLPLFESVESDE